MSLEIITLPADQVRAILSDFKNISERNRETERELAALKADKYVSIEWVAELWSVTTDTARDMIQVLAKGRKNQPDIKVLSYGPKVVRYRRSDIERITSENLVALKDMLAQKRANRSSRN